MSMKFEDHTSNPEENDSIGAAIPTPLTSMEMLERLIELEEIRYDSEENAYYWTSDGERIPFT